jgi:allantoate deiminase
VGIEKIHNLPASPCAPDLMDLMDAGIAATGQSPLRLVSGAGHDAMVMAAVCPTAMLFIRCRGGVSHHPEESVEVADVEAAFVAMMHFIEGLGAKHV